MTPTPAEVRELLALAKAATPKLLSPLNDEIAAWQEWKLDSDALKSACTPARIAALCELALRGMPRESLQAMCDNAYCKALELARGVNCLGEEAKMSRGVFGPDELKAHRAMEHQMGRHTAFADVLRMYDAAKEGKP